MIFSFSGSASSCSVSTVTLLIAYNISIVSAVGMRTMQTVRHAKEGTIGDGQSTMELTMQLGEWAIECERGKIAESE